MDDPDPRPDRLTGEDLIQRVALWNTATGGYDAPALGKVIQRLCSADLPERGAFSDERSKAGYPGRLFMNGEEIGAGGRAFAVTEDGIADELPHLGRFSWENSVTQPATGARTVVVGTDDSAPGQVYVYVGTMRRTGTPVERAGLVGGTLDGVRVVDNPDESIPDGIPSGTRFELVDLGDVPGKSGATFQAESEAAGVTEFRRPEDGAWNPRDRGGSCSSRPRPSPRRAACTPSTSTAT